MTGFKEFKTKLNELVMKRKKEMFRPMLRVIYEYSISTLNAKF